jgi:hypothetical protein
LELAAPVGAGYDARHTRAYLEGLQAHHASGA